ncbi:autotransporter outer membrane beta-barrel domain-containing protein [Hyphomicrobium sp. D-2]|uniref:autotransporter outer membrane beta-barrel domain-containing protein n=1 Tax=Hyphomicrobium sp. D-2 TaxID=3041621 RepID=UPI002458F3ED|nr:autotransporter outer membrane beta-barrel domain-containing protein [Hyphomicrobium sp. D-2]MDH4981827.1 autotransporter outer membrane beta-barrel domain-containing protein [Hyphomicrobium sp. D-2]
MQLSITSAIASISVFALGFLSASAPALSQTIINIPDGQNLAPVSTGSNTVWEFDGDAFLTGNKNIGSGLVMSGVPPDSVITLNNGAGVYGKFTASQFTADNIVIANGNGNGSEGGAMGGSSLSIDGTRLIFRDNFSTGRGGAIFISGNFTSSVDHFELRDNYGQDFGGGLHTINGNISFTNTNGTLIVSGNRTDTSGGGLWSNNGSRIIIDSRIVTFEDNIGGSGYGYGGGVRSGGSVSASGEGFQALNPEAIVTFTNNQAWFGGGGVNVEYGIAIAGTAVFTNNRALYENGGGFRTGYGISRLTIGNNGGTTTSTVSDNYAGVKGGGAYVGTVSVDGSLTLTGNIAGGSGSFDGGGGFYLDEAASSDIGGAGAVLVLDNNLAGFNQSGAATAFGSGGAIYSDSALSLAGSQISISGNKSTNFGGGLYLSASATSTIGGAATTLVIEGNTAGYNETGGVYNAFASGGAIYSLAPLILTGSSISLANNMATLDGGAIRAGGPLSIQGPMIAQGNSSGGNGGAIWGGSDVTLSVQSGSTVFSGNTHNGASTAAANAIYLATGGTTLSLDAASGSSIEFFDPIASNLANSAVAVEINQSGGSGRVLFSGEDHASLQNRTSEILADTTVHAGTFELRDGAVYGVNAPGSSFNLTAGAEFESVVNEANSGNSIRADDITLSGRTSLQGSHVQTLTFDGNVVHGGQIIAANGNLVGSEVVVRGNYTGQGGTLGINTQLGGDGSPSDRLVIDGGTGTGTSQLAVNNVGGLGDLTQLNGILVVDAINGGTTVPGLFALAGPVVAGPYEYSLYRGSEDASNPNAWYLRSELNCALDPTAPVCGDGIPDWRQETSLYAAVPAMTLLYGRLMLDTLHERRGTAVSPYAEGAPNAAWARVIGQHGDRDGGKGGIYGAGPKYDYDFWAFQGGMDLYRDGDVSTSRNHAGAFFAIGHGSGDVQHIGDGKAGENSFMAYSWGAYWTHYTPDNAYVDALLLGSWYDIDAKSNRIPKMKTDGGAFGASLEGGYPVYTGPGGFSIEPQAQLAYQTINLNNGSDVAAQVHFDNVNSLVGRVGVRFAQDFGTPTWLTGSPSTFTAWVRPNFWYEFLGDPKTKFSSATGFIPFAADMGGTTFEINTGFSTDIGDGAAIYANASYLVGIGEHADGNAYDGKLGVKVAW